MLIVALKPGHDGAVAVIEDRTLLYSVEAEKDSFKRYAPLIPATLLSVAEQLDRVPDVLALGGWYYRIGGYGSGYDGTGAPERRRMRFFGKDVEFFTSTHERSHIMCSLGMAPRSASPLQTVLVWEGATGAFFMVDQEFNVVRKVDALSEPGMRYGFVYALADPAFPDQGAQPHHEYAGKLMALAAHADAKQADADVERLVDRILGLPTVSPAPKGDFRDSPIYNAGVESEICTMAAALITQRIFEIFARTAEQQLPAGTPLRIAGGCGLNCDWNAAWREFPHFSSVFVPPCPNDSGSALGTAIDALLTHTGDPHINWSVYSGLEFERDTEPDPTRWSRRPLVEDQLADTLASGRVVAWVQGRWELGPRALGNRSLLAEPFSSATHARLNQIKQRESYRPIAPVCRAEDIAAAFREDFEDPYMLYFRRVRMPELKAVTHVDGSARAQTVTRQANRPLHDLLTAFARRTGIGVLCNTSLNFKGLGFINRMSDLVTYCDLRGVDDMVVGREWFTRLPEG